MATTFISYVREDQSAALRLYHDLKRYGHAPWIDVHNIRPGEIWELAIERALLEASYVVVLLSRQSVKKRGTYQLELKRALEIMQRIPEEQIFLIPARLDECEFPVFAMRKINRVDLFPDYDDGLRKILGVLSQDSSGEPKLNTELEEALSLFRRRLFAEAARALGLFVKRNPECGEARYYLVLSFLAGKRPRLLSSEIVAKIEQHLLLAMARDPGPHIRLLCAIVKYDCYIMNGLREPPPMVSDLLAANVAANVQIDCARAEELRSVLSVPGNPVWEGLGSR